MDNCPICISDYNKSTRSCIECAGCSFKSCQTCVKTYLLQSHLDAHCMNCRKAWDRRFLADVFPTSFLTKDYKSHRADVLFERERSLFPDTMIHIQRDKQIDKIRENIYQLVAKQNKIKSDIYNLQRQLYNLEHTTTNIKEKQKSHHVRPCVAEDCKGYINEETGICGICSKRTCVKCNVLLTEEEHTECKEDDLSVWAEIKKNTRPCPNCHVRIHKISGCYQMWCPQCHTAFNYNTGQIEKGAIHNPHYYDYLRQNPNAGNHAAEPVPFCGGNRLPEAWRITRILNKHKDKDDWMNFHRLLQHIQNVEIPKYRNRDADFTLDLRKKYMLNEMDEKNFKKRIQEREKRAKKNEDMRTIWEMFFNVGKDMIVSVSNNQPTDDLHDQMKNLINYVNDSITSLNYNYQSRLPRIQKFNLY